MTTLAIPELSLVALIGPSGAGKSTFARKHFRPTEVLSSDFFRGLIADDQADQAVSADAFDVLHLVAAKRLAHRRLTVIDATNVQPEHRKQLLEIARKHNCPAAALVFALPEGVCHDRNRLRPDRTVAGRVIHVQWQNLRASLGRLEGEGFSCVHVLSTPEEMDAAVVERRPLLSNRKGEHGPFDIIGDVHGCLDELLVLLGKLGYEITPRAGDPGYDVRSPAGRKLIFLGDLVDRGPKTPGVLRLVMDLVAAGTGLCVIGNHDDKLLRKLKGSDVRMTHALAGSLEQLGQEPAEFTERVVAFLASLPSHLELDDGKLVVAHAGLLEKLQGRLSRRVRDFALYGETTGESDEFGLPVRCNWALEYRGPSAVVYGHTPVPEPEWLNNTINIDTGCAFGGKLTALRYPERELVSVAAARIYCEPARPFLPAAEVKQPDTASRSD
jgi:polynucleotide kinase-phosphatase